MSKQTYAEQRLDPRWQKRRLEIMARDKFACRECEDKKSTLNVHHRYYVAGRSPWMYPDFALVTLCESCHKQDHDSLKDLDTDDPPLHIVTDSWETVTNTILGDCSEVDGILWDISYTIHSLMDRGVSQNDILKSIQSSLDAYAKPIMLAPRK